MNFISAEFLVFLAVVFILYFLVPKKTQWIVLLVASYTFYLFSGVAAFALLLVTTTITFFTGILLGKVNQEYALATDTEKLELTREQKQQIKAKKNKQKKWILTAALLLVFGILAFMKYYNFFALNISSLLGLFTPDLKIPGLNLLLPLGISFYTFQSAGYLIDVNRGKIAPDRNLPKFALFVSFFPQIVQGPISRYDELARQLYEHHYFDYTRAKFGLQLILWGIFKKLVIADRAAIIVNTIFNHYPEYEGFTIFMAALLYCMQVYCDFSGGIDIARGIAQVMGIDLPQNFARPFFATSIEDFWRRWHITLSAWVRDYIFYPLSLSKSFTRLGRSARKLLGNQFGKLVPTFLAMIITFLTLGIWHGANWKFVVYGIYNGLLIFFGILFHPIRDRLKVRNKIKNDHFGWRFFEVLTTLILVGFGRYFSRAPSLAVAGDMFKRTFQAFNPRVFFDGTFLNLGLDQKNFYLLLIVMSILIIVELFQEKGVQLRQKISEQHFIFRWVVYLVILFLILIFGVYGIGYNATSFIYRGI